MMKRFLVVPLLLLPLLTPAQNQIAHRPFGQQVVAFSATPTFDASKSSAFKITLTGNVTSSSVIGAEAGQQLTIEVCQDGTGGRTFAWPGTMVGPIAILAGINVCTVEVFDYDGTSATIYTTTTAGGGGSGTVNSGTAKCFTWYAATGTTVSNDCNLDDGLTNALGLTYAGANGIYATQFNSTSGGGSFVAIGTEGTPSGAAAGKDVLALGDLTSHTAQISNNGDSFRSIGVFQSTSPVQLGPLLAGSTFPQMTAASRGTQGQPFLEGSLAGGPGYGQLDLSLSTNVVNRLVKANQTSSTLYNDQANTLTAAGTLDASASTVASAVRTPNVAGLTTLVNGAIGYDTTSNNFHGGAVSADHLLALWAGSLPANNDCIKATVVSSHVELASAGTGVCGSGGTPRLDQILSATSGWTTSNADNPLLTQFATTTAGRIGWRLTESGAGTSTGTPFLHQIDTLAGSTLNPLQVCAGGTANCWRFDTASLLKPIGAAALAIPGSAKGVVVSQGGTAAATTVTGTLNQLISFDGSGNPIAADPIISYNYVNIWTAQDVTVTRTSAAVRNSIFSQSGTLQLTWASITGSPATCTLQIQGVDSVGNALNNGSTFSVSPANGTTSQTFNAAATLQSAAQIKAIFACGTYPTTGTLTLDFTPVPNVNVTNTVTALLAAGSAIVGKVGIDQTTPGTTNAVSTTNLPTTVDTNSGTKSASTLRVVLATDQPALTNKLLVTPDSVALPAHQSTNVDQVNGTTADTNSGTKSAGTLRVVLATDQPALTNKLLVTPDANVKVNVVGNAGANVDGATGAAVPANAVMAGLKDTAGNIQDHAGDTNGRQIVKVYPDTTTLSYRASKKFALSSTTDIAVMPGNATNTVLLTRVLFSCTQTTAGIVNVEVIKRSTADTSGTSAAMTAVPDDANYAAAVSAPLSYTGTGPTVGTAIGDADNYQLGCNAAATAGANDIYVLRPAKPIVLRGTAQMLTINLGGAVTGGTGTLTLEWMETVNP